MSIEGLTPVKQASKSCVRVCEKLCYTVALTNSGTNTATDVVFSDSIPSGAVFIDGRLCVNGSHVNANPNPPGFTIPDIGPGKTTTVSFEVCVVSVPGINPMLNSANVSYSYGTSVPDSVYSNIVATTVITTPRCSAMVDDQSYRNYQRQSSCCNRCCYNPCCCYI